LSAHAAFALGVIFFGLWITSLAVHNSSIVDPLWGPAFSIVTTACAFENGGLTSRQILITALVALWGARLGGYLFLRNRGHGEDFRYAAMRKTHGDRFWIVSLFTVFLLQGGLVWIVSLPIQAAFATDRSIGPLDLVATTISLFGLVFESIADLQLSRFRKDPASKGQVFDHGLWSWSRHPNYFGEAVVWWGFAIFGLASGAPWSVIGPIIMTVLLLKVSGVALLESTIVERRPAYAAYIARTSAFIPRPPRR